MIKKILNFLPVLLVFLLVSFIFYGKFYWHELIFDRSTVGAVYGEVQASEWGMENIYQSLIKGQNPFQPIKTILYPFGIDTVASDAGFAFNFLFFRPFLSPHQALSLIVVFDLILANIGMYVLLRKMGFEKILSVILALAYGNMTFLTERMGHPGYSVIYLFPWSLAFFFMFSSSKNSLVKLFYSFMIVFLTAMTLWENMYYFIILLIGVSSLCFYFLFFKRKLFFRFIKENFLYLLFSFLIGGLLLIPWLFSLYQSIYFNEVPKTLGWSGAIEFSSDFFGFLIPSGYNYYYGSAISLIGKHVKFIRYIFEGFNYPGIIIIATYLFLFLKRDKIPEKVRESIFPFFWASLLFFVLTLGPFLHVFGGWWIQLEDGIRLVLPLPFVFLHYMPMLGNIRAPGRLAVGMIFFAYIVCGYVLSDFLKNKTERFKLIFFLLLFAIFFIDHRPVSDITINPVYSPKKIFSEIKKDNSKVTVMETPFVVRDGFTYFGDFNSIGITIGQMIHQKPVIGGYSGRVPDYIKQYYINNPFLGYLGRLIDDGITTNQSFDKSDLKDWQKPDINSSEQAVDFLDLKYIIADEKNKHFSVVNQYLKQLGFKVIDKDSYYILLARQPKETEFLNIDLSAKNSSILLGMGWNTNEKKFLWANRKSSVMFKINKKRDLYLDFEALAFFKNQPVTIYLNQKKISRLTVSSTENQYKVAIHKNDLNTGINTVYFIFDKAYRPYDVIPGSLDRRQIACQFSRIWLENR